MLGQLPSARASNYMQPRHGIRSSRWSCFTCRNHGRSRPSLENCSRCLVKLVSADILRQVLCSPHEDTRVARCSPNPLSIFLTLAVTASISRVQRNGGVESHRRKLRRRRSMQQCMHFLFLAPLLLYSLTSSPFFPFLKQSRSFLLCYSKADDPSKQNY